MCRIKYVWVILLSVSGTFGMTQNPSAEFSEGITIGTTQDAPSVGTIRFNPNTEDFEGYDGSVWKSLTFSAAQWGLSANLVNEDFQIDQPNGPGNYSGDLNSSPNYLICGGTDVAIYELTQLGWALDTLFPQEGVIFGKQVAIDDDFAFISKDDSLYVYQQTPSSWSKVQTLFFHVDNIQDIQVRDDRLIVGGRNYAAIYQFDGQQWLFDQSIVPNDLVSSDEYGWSVDVLDTVAVVSTPLQTNFDGAVYIFHLRNGSWVQVDKLLGATNEAQFGRSVALDYNHVFIGIPFAHQNGNFDEGRIDLFTWNGTSYMPDGSIVQGTNLVVQSFGTTLDLYEDDLVVYGQQFVNAVMQGALFFYRRLGNNWTLQARFVQSDPANQDRFGEFLTLAEDWAVAGALNTDKLYFISK